MTLRNYPALRFSNGTPCYVCNRELTQDGTYQVLYASLDAGRFSKPRRKLFRDQPVTIHRLSEYPRYIKKFVLVCESCVIAASFQEIYGFGNCEEMPVLGDGVSRIDGKGDTGHEDFSLEHDDINLDEL